MKHKLILISAFLFVGVSDKAFGQDFLVCYKKFELSLVHERRELVRKEVVSITIKNLDFLRRTTEAYQSKSGHSIFSADTVFIIALMDTDKVHNDYGILWSGRKSCYYRYKEKADTNGHMHFSGFSFYGDASTELKKLPVKVKTWILSSDTANFKKYAGDRLAPPFCCAISFVRAVRTKNHHWKFIKMASAHFIDL